MALTGNLKTMQIAEMLQWCKMGEKTGILTLKHDDVVKTILIENSKIISASSNDPNEYIGQRLLASGKIGEDDLQQAFEKQKNTRAMLGQILIDGGKVTAEDLEEVMHEKILETVFDIFLWEDGEFSFKEEILAKDQSHYFVELDIDFCIFEGVRRLDEWQRYREVFPDDNMVLCLEGPSPPRFDNAPLKRKIIEILSNGSTITEIRMELRGHAFVILSTLYELLNDGHIQVTGKIREDTPHPKKVSSKAFRNEEEEVAHIYEKVLSKEKVPIVLSSMDNLRGHELTASEVFVISRINGSWDIQSIVKICPLKEVETLRILQRFKEEKLIAVL